MSRIGNKLITIPAGVEVTVNDATVTVKGPKGTLTKTFENCIEMTINGQEMTFAPKNGLKHTHQMHGTTRAIVANMIKGVTEGYKKVLIIEGTGYKAELKNGGLELSLGFSHKINVAAPAGITFTVPKLTQIEVEGIDKEVVGQISAEIRAYKKPEPYHGKGIHYSDEKIRRKEIKKAGK